MARCPSTNLSAVVDVLVLGISLEDIRVPPAAAENARRFGQHNLSLEALLRAYRLGEHTFLQWVIQDLSRWAILLMTPLRSPAASPCWSTATSIAS
jgi:hypothetical protein